MSKSYHDSHMIGYEANCDFCRESAEAAGAEIAATSNARSYITEGGVWTAEEREWYLHRSAPTSRDVGREEARRASETVSALIRALGDLHEECDDRCLPEDGPCKYLDLLAALKGEK